MIRKISKEEAQILREQGAVDVSSNWRPGDYDLTGYYMLSDGQFLVDLQHGGHALVFGNDVEYRNYLDSVTKGKPSHPLQGFPNTPGRFLDLVELSAKRLEDKLKIDQLDFSIESLKRIDDSMQRRTSGEGEYFQDIYPLLVPYVSQTIIKQLGGEWVFRKAKGFDIIEPYIALPDGRVIKTFQDLYVDAQEDYANFSVHDTAIMRTDNLLL